MLKRKGRKRMSIVCWGMDMENNRMFECFMGFFLFLEVIMAMIGWMEMKLNLRGVCGPRQPFPFPIATPPPLPLKTHRSI